MKSTDRIAQNVHVEFSHRFDSGYEWQCQGSEGREGFECLLQLERNKAYRFKPLNAHSTYRSVARDFLKYPTAAYIEFTVGNESLTFTQNLKKLARHSVNHKVVGVC